MTRPVPYPGRVLEGIRDEVVIATKAVSVPHSERRFDASRRHLLSALDASLARLGTDYVDVWQLHAYDELTPMEETLAALDIAVNSGKARYVGVANYSGWQLASAASWQRAVPGRAQIASVQMEYSLLQRGVEREVAPAAVAVPPVSDCIQLAAALAAGGTVALDTPTTSWDCTGTRLAVAGT